MYYAETRALARSGMMPLVGVENFAAKAFRRLEQPRRNSGRTANLSSSAYITLTYQPGTPRTRSALSARDCGERRGSAAWRSGSQRTAWLGKPREIVSP